jgi:hypothetical protein
MHMSRSSRPACGSGLSFEPFVASAVAGAILAVQVMAWKPRLKTMGTAP